MRVLMTGATGLIGSAVVRRLSDAGHELVLVVREVDAAKARWPHAHVVPGGFGGDTPPWPDYLRGVDVVINAVGIFTEQAGQSFDAVHVKGPVALFRAAIEARVRRVIQISALGASPYRDEAYLSTKGRADAELTAMPIESTIVRPSLVFSAEGPSTQWFAALAALPLTPLPGGGGQHIQPVHIDDVADAIARLVVAREVPGELILVGPHALTLRRYLAALKHGIGAGGGFVSIPSGMLRGMSALFGRFSPWLSGETMRMLDAGSTAAPAPLTNLLGREPREVETFVDDGNRAGLRLAAMLQWLRPLLRWSIALMWLVTAYVSALVYPVRDSLALLARTGLHGVVADIALYGAAAADALLGVMLFAPRWRRLSYSLQLLLIAGYTVIITIFLPEYWAHPYGPILKNLPLLAAIATARELDAPHGRHRR
ncbi:SDR family oxidoreductase [Lysobacter auxotrophicus]|uniref:NAD(P)H-binding protein n=1 Tax=Lysobacter auxotrophicus TaxID=2992573 RepID=A0ABN6UJB3_9GAMM|nr:SDR family oxidoreductase [Lysobacter auxotrophicus]BDU16398.1 NAD(P)H-binding protein [Lysobacter auxotrophicus]